MNFIWKILAAIAVALVLPRAAATTFYVNVINTVPLAPYTNWPTAATNIQDAVDAASDGDLVLVTNGIYQTGGRVVFGALTNRLVINKALTVRSVNGPAATIIRGYGYFSDDAVRCVYLTNNAVLSGFNLTNGATRQVNWPTPTPENCGGGVWCESTSAVVSNCVVNGNTCFMNGGGVYGATVLNSSLLNNYCSQGAGAASCVASNCYFISNSASVGGAASESSLYGCVLAQNSASSGGGGTYDCFLMQCTVTNNTGLDGGGAYNSRLLNCLVIGNSANRDGGGLDVSSATNTTITGNVVSLLANSGGTPASGGGASGSTLVRCLISNNQVVNAFSDSRKTQGGGASGGTLIGCLVNNNTANWYFGGGGGAYNANVINCTIVGNSTYASGGGTFNCNVTNSIVQFNTSNYKGGTFSYSCASPLPGGLGNTAANPLWINQGAGNFRLLSNSPCINSGINLELAGTNDLDGNPRIRGGTVDIGCYEFQSPASTLSYAWAQQFGLPTDGSADFSDTDGDRLNNWQEWLAGTTPTNAASLLRMNPPTNAAPGLSVSWQSVNTRTYFLQRSTNLPAFSTIQSNLTGQASTTTFTDTSATNGGSYFYRVGVQ